MAIGLRFCKTTLWGIAVASLALQSAAEQHPAVTCNGSPFEYTTVISGGEDDPPTQLNEKAAGQLEIEVLQRCFGNLDSSETQLDNSGITFDRMIVSLSGQVTEYQQLKWHRVQGTSEDTESVQTYELTARVAVRGLPGKADPGFSVKARMDRLVYIDGDSARITVTLTQPAYVYIFNISNGVVAQVFPNQYAPQNQLLPGDNHIPTDDQIAEHQKLILTADPTNHRQTWAESFVVLATKKQLDLSGLGVREAINRPLQRSESADAHRFAGLLLDQRLKRDEVAQCSVRYQMQSRQQH